MAGFEVKNHSLFTDYDIELFNIGQHFKLYEKFGSHIVEVDGDTGVYFSVYAPSASKVEVIGDFNGWDGHQQELFVRWDSSGIWEGFIPGLKKGDLYKYRIHSHHDRKVREKADPYARQYEMPPKSASVVWSDNYDWKDKSWLADRHKTNSLQAPISVYELHIGSWKKNREQSRSLHYTELAKDLVEYVLDMGYTHVELMPVMEHPYYPSWGYQCTGYFAPSSRYGNPDELKLLIDAFHENGIGVFLDWVPAHFPNDEHALADFDGSELYEHPDPKKGKHPDWNSLIFNYERPQVRSFLISSAHYWCDQFHADGLRVDAVASMIYLDYSRNDGEWEANEFGENEYVSAIQMLKDLNKSIYRDFPDVQMIAEESTAFFGVTRPVHLGGLGFGLKWMMGWMNDTLEYFGKEPIYRRYHQDDITHSLLYAFSENYMLPLSHDEVVHGKQSLLTKMPGDNWQKFANLRLLYTYMYTHPGQKLNFMGGEIGQWEEWDVNSSVSWHLLDFDPHKGVQSCVRSLNQLYRNETALFKFNYGSEGFEWLDISDAGNSVISYIRKAGKEYVIVILNFTPTKHDKYKIGVPEDCAYEEVFNSDIDDFNGSGVSNASSLLPKKESLHGKEYSVEFALPPLGGIVLKPKAK